MASRRVPSREKQGVEVKVNWLPKPRMEACARGGAGDFVGAIVWGDGLGDDFEHAECDGGAMEAEVDPAVGAEAGEMELALVVGGDGVLAAEGAEGEGEAGREGVVGVGAFGVGVFELFVGEVLDGGDGDGGVGGGFAGGVEDGGIDGVFVGREVEVEIAVGGGVVPLGPGEGEVGGGGDDAGLLPAVTGGGAGAVGEGRDVGFVEGDFIVAVLVGVGGDDGMGVAVGLAGVRGNGDGGVGEGLAGGVEDGSVDGDRVGGGVVWSGGRR